MLFSESLPGWLLAQAKQDCFRVRPDLGTIVKETRQGRIYDYHFFEGCQNSLIICIERKLPKNSRICVPWHSPHVHRNRAQPMGALRRWEKSTT